MTTAIDPRPPETTAAPAAPKPAAAAPAPAPMPGAPPAQGSGYRSIADGELASAWSLKDYFGSLNTVMRLPPKMRKRVEAIEKKTGIKLPDIKLPKGVVALAFGLATFVLVVRPLMAAMGSASAPPTLTSAYGVWEARTGKYAGRMFELGEHSIAFRTSSQSPDYTWHKITEMRAKTPGSDSTLFVVSYDEDGKTADFSFWYITAPEVAIRLEHTPDVTWRKTVYEPIARPDR